MKWTILVAALALLMACGGGEAPADETAAANEEATGSENDSEETEEVLVLYPEGTIDPATVTPDQVIAAEDLNAACFAWNEMEVTVAGHPFIWYGDSAAVEEEVGLVMDPEGDEELVTANLTEVPEMYLHRGEIIAVTGTPENSWSGPELNDAVIAEAPENLEHIETSPWIYDGQAIPADQFCELYYAWVGMEVTVEGYYSSTTTSTLTNGVVVRVDLGANNDHYSKMAACEMAEEIPEAVSEAMVANREGVQIRGTISGESSDCVGLESCVIVNR